MAPRSVSWTQGPKVLKGSPPRNHLLPLAPAASPISPARLACMERRVALAKVKQQRKQYRSRRGQVRDLKAELKAMAKQNARIAEQDARLAQAADTNAKLKAELARDIVRLDSYSQFLVEQPVNLYANARRATSAYLCL